MADDCNSPYKSYSAFGGNPYLVDLRILAADGYLTAEELDAVKQETPWACEFDKLTDTRLSILRLAATRATSEDKAEIAAFAAENPYLEQFCEFMARRAANGDTPWYEWTSDEVDESEHFAWQFIQYHFMKQWAAVRAYANEKGIRIMGDIPIYVAYDSCDVWANRDQFQLDEDGRPTSVAGCPPDYFSEDGQFWGNPLYDWDRMKEDGFAWWSARMNHMLTLFDGVRIDHFRGLEAYWSIPADAKSAKEGHWEPGPREAFVEQLHRVVDACEAKLGYRPLIVAEDLGESTPELAAFVQNSGFPGMRVLQFGFDGDTANIHLPHNYVANTVAYTGTHDNNTLLGYVWECTDETRRDVLDYCGFIGEEWNCPETYDAIIRTLLRSVADLAILPIQDVLGFGSDCRMNTPGEAEGNWSYRITKEQLDAVDPARFARMNRLYGRYAVTALTEDEA
jgi:4-alpha-glucanotransferase